MKIFPGFLPGSARPVPLPDAFFSDLLPLIDDLGEMQVTLACFRIVTRKSGSPRAIRWADLTADDGLRAALDEPGLRTGLERAVTRGTLLHVLVDVGDGPEDLYFINTERGREAARELQRGERPERLAPAEPPVPSAAERPNIFKLYEQNIGLLTPMLADELRDAEASYPAAWIEDAFREAVRQNARSWTYVRKILERRERREKRGARGQTAEDRRKYIEGKYADFIEY
jgi:DnaD/phage-associated family protein